MKSQTSKLLYFLLLVLVIAMIVTFLINRPSAIESRDLEHRVLVVAGQLHAPGDKNTMTVATSSLTLAQHMRYQIQTDIQAGMSNQQIIAKMEQTYGEGVLAAPADHGEGRLAWFTPWLVLAVLFGGVYWYLRRISVRQRSEIVPNENRTEQLVTAKNMPESERDVALNIPEQLKDYL